MVRKTPIAPAPAIHQMCQISAKPVTTAKNAMMKPVALFFGISIGSNLRSFGGLAFVRLRCFFFPRAWRSVDCGKTGKIPARGGEAGAHLGGGPRPRCC